MITFLQRLSTTLCRFMLFESPCACDEGLWPSRAVSSSRILRMAGWRWRDTVEHVLLRLVLTTNLVETMVCDRGIALFTTKDERVKRIRRVLCKPDQEKGMRAC